MKLDRVASKTLLPRPGSSLPIGNDPQILDEACGQPMTTIEQPSVPDFVPAEAFHSLRAIWYIRMFLKA